MNPASLESDPLDQLAEAFLERLRRGERPALTEYTEKYPELAERIRKLFPALMVLEDFGSVDGQSPGSEVARAALKGQIPGRLGEYRILREVGRGGMGIVYEAVQESLGRHVALKVLPFHGLLGPTRIERFRREAKAAARLHHTNIVPVFGVGEQDGIHYYAMQFILGQGLDDVLQEVRRLRGSAPTPNRPNYLAASVAEGLLSGQFPDSSSTQVPPPHHAEGDDYGGPHIPREGGAGEVGDDKRTKDESEQGKSAKCEVRNPESETRSPPPPYPPPGSGEGRVRGFRASDLSSDSSFLAAPSSLSSQPETRYYRCLAEVGAQVADALAYAHREGVLHRDVKPSNLLLDTSGRVWVTDFGLAKAEDSDDLTQTGDMIGTLCYMAPERLQGQADARSDVYGLGITLYEMLTLKPAFGESNRAHLIERIAHQEPAAPRTFDSRIPRDLETIVLKAIAKEPARRYSSAEALAEDLRRVLADRPIRARRISPLERTWRWCRRNPGLATSIASVAVLLIVVALVASWSAYTTRYQLQLTQDAEREATRQLCRSLVGQARASRFSQRMGQRFDSLRALQAAANIARKLDMPADSFLELRNEAIACMALPDMRGVKEWEGWPSGTNWVDFDATLERYARADRAGHVSVRRVADDTLICQLPDLPPVDLWFRFSDDGQFLGVWPGGHNWLKVWNLSGPKSPPLLDGLAFRDFSFSPDSRRVAVAHGDGSIDVSELPSGRGLRRLPPGPPLAGIAFGPDSQQLAVSRSGGIQILDLGTGKIVADLPQAGFSRIAWHPEGKMLAAIMEPENQVYLWDVPARKQTAVLKGHNHSGISCTFANARDLLATTCWDGKLRLWDCRTGKLLFSTPWGWSPWLRFSPDDHLLAAQVDGSKLRIWEVAAGREYRTLNRDPVLGKSSLVSAAVHGDGRLLAVGMQDGFGLFDLESGRALDFIKLPGQTHVLFEPGGLLTPISGVLKRWPVQPDPAAPASLRVGPPQKLSLPESASSVSGDSRVMAIPQLWGALVLHRDRPDQLIRLEPHEDVRSVAVSPDRHWVATGSHGASVQAKVWDAQTGKLEKELPAGAGQQVAFSPDGRWLATSGDGVRAWEVGSWRLGADKEAVMRACLAFSPDSRLLAYETGHGAVCLVDPQTGRDYARLEDPSRPDQDRATRICFSPDGTRLVAVSGDSQSVHVWDLRAVREQLAEMGLDWDLPAYPPAKNQNEEKPIQVQVLPDEAAVFRRGVEMAELGNWGEAAAEQRRAFQLQFPEEPHRWLDFADLQLWTEDIEGYRLTCREMLKRFGSSQNPDDIAFLAHACVLGPDALHDAARVLQLAEQRTLLSPPPSKHHFWSIHILALAYYRAGKYERAVEYLNTNQEKVRGWGPNVLNWVVLALAHAQLQHADESKKWLNRAQEWIKTNTPDGGRPVPAGWHWRDWLELQLLRQEAEVLIAPKSKDSSPSKTKPATPIP